MQTKTSTDYSTGTLQISTGFYLAALATSDLQRLAYLVARWRERAPRFSDHLVLAVQAELARQPSTEPTPLCLPVDWDALDYGQAAGMFWAMQQFMGPRVLLQSMGHALADILYAKTTESSAGGRGVG